jgi:DNA adenine methylase
VKIKETNTFIKWPGGKHWLVPLFLEICPDDFQTYYEPFVGGGSIYFAIEPESTVIADISIEIINLYRTMRDYPLQLAEKLKEHENCHCEKYYYKVRSHIPKDQIGQAARTLYLNRTCYNGMYRANKAGMFNVPIGTKINCTYDIDSFEKISQKLQTSQIECCDFASHKAYKQDYAKWESENRGCVESD